MLLREFVRGLPLQIDYIKEAVLKKDKYALIRTAHSLKGSSLNVGAIMIGIAAAELETAGANDDLKSCPETITKLETEAALFCEHTNKIDWGAI